MPIVRASESAGTVPSVAVGLAVLVLVPVAESSGGTPHGRLPMIVATAVGPPCTPPPPWTIVVLVRLGGSVVVGRTVWVMVELVPVAVPVLCPTGKVAWAAGVRHSPRSH